MPTPPSVPALDLHGDVVDLAVGAASAVMQRPIDRAGAAGIVDRALAN